MKHWILPLLAIVGLCFSISFVLRARQPHEKTMPPAPPPQALKSNTVGAVGLVEPASENIDLGCAVSGVITSVDAKAGDTVKKGQVLFEIDQRDSRAQLAARQADLDLARVQLRKLEQEPRPEELPSAEAKVQEAKSALQDAETQKTLIESVSDRRAVKQEDLLRRRIAYASAEARLKQAQADLALLKSGAWEPDKAIARVQIQQAEANLRAVEVEIERRVVRAPMDGTILQSKVHPGQYASCSPGSDALMIFGGGDGWNVRTDIDESEAWRVKPGNTAFASARGNSAARYPLEFSRFEPYIVPKKSLTGDSTERVDTRVLQAIFRFKGARPAVYIGEQMDVFIEAGEPVRP
jgi:biotin carboxyl carrier protein